MIWVILALVILTFIGIWVSIKGVHKVNTNGNVFVRYLFVYKIIEGDPKGLPTEFLVDWQISNLENHLYILCLTLEEDLYIEGYLNSVWVEYKGLDNVYVDVYMIEDIVNNRHVLIGKFYIKGGKMYYFPVH